MPARGAGAVGAIGQRPRSGHVAKHRLGGRRTADISKTDEKDAHHEAFSKYPPRLRDMA